MHPPDLKPLADRLLAGAMSLDDFARQAATVLQNGQPGAQAALPFATLDFDRRRRCGFPEVVYGDGKPPELLLQILHELAVHGDEVLATRVSAESAALVTASIPAARYNELARTIRIEAPSPGAEARPAADGPHVAVITAGTSDLAVAEEARETLDWMGVRVTLIQDVGVAGPHRLSARVQEFQDADAIVVVAGMEGALPSIVGGYVACPVIAVPTSIGYGANFGGISALLSMLNSCASNVAVVNIDAGFKGAYLAGLIATRNHRTPDANR